VCVSFAGARLFKVTRLGQFISEMLTTQTNYENNELILTAQVQELLKKFGFRGKCFII
jgi:hypothetical protein